MKNFFYLIILFVPLIFSNCLLANKILPYDIINSSLITAMEADHVPVVGYAVINNNKVVYANTISINSTIHPTVHSLFQAASISKSIAAYTALRLVSLHQLELDLPVNNYLIHWKIPFNDYQKNSSVTLREILSMTSGLSVPGFFGFPQGQPLPSSMQILNGAAPANNDPVQVIYKPGTQYFYSGGGFQVLEQMIDDTCHQSFVKVAKTLVLAPLKMSDSTYDFPVAKDKLAQVIPGFLSNGQEIPQGWNNYAIPAAGGLWSTPTDLAKFAIALAKKQYLSAYVASQLFIRINPSSFGLGVVVNGQKNNLNFRKAGHNIGYISQLIMFPNTGQGLVIMTDSENGEYIINYLIPMIAHYFNWPQYFPYYGENFAIPNYV